MIVDDSLFQGLEKDHPLNVRKKEYDKIKQQLGEALKARADKNKKTTPDDDKKKAILQRQLLKQQTLFKEE